MLNNWKLSPSDFAFLWEDCKRCFYLKVARNFPQPRSIMASIFIKIDNEMKNCFDGKRIEEMVSGFPAGIVKHGEKWVESRPIVLPNEPNTCFIRGKFDTIVKFDDGSYGVVDFKTSHRKSEHMPLYARQLHAYAYALENPAPRKFSVSPVSKLGLLVYEPDNFAVRETDKALLAGGITWIEIQRNDKEFFDFLKEVMALLRMPSPPPANHDCQYCKYRENSRGSNY